MYTFTNAVKDFINHCKFEKNLSPKTIKAYEIDLKQLQEFFKKKEFPLEMHLITKFHIREYLEDISSLKPKSIKRKIASAKVLLNYLEFEEFISINPLRKVKIKIKESKQLPRVMQSQEVELIAKQAYRELVNSSKIDSYGHFEALRNLVVVELLYATGARVSEISGLRAERIDLTVGSIVIRGKGDKERGIEICNRETLNLLKEYFSLYSERILKSGGFFLVNRFGNRLSEQSIRSIVKNLTTKSGITRHITPHVFRHSLATLLLENDVDIKYIQVLLGHSSIMTTQIYTHVNKAKQREILNTKHPRREFSMLSVNDG